MIAWITVEYGNMFDGTPDQFENAFGGCPGGLTPEYLRTWASLEKVAINFDYAVGSVHDGHGYFGCGCEIPCGVFCD